MNTTFSDRNYECNVEFELLIPAISVDISTDIELLYCRVISVSCSLLLVFYATCQIMYASTFH